MTDKQSPATIAVRAALESDTQHGAVVPPIHLTSTYAFSGFGEKGAYDYTRSGNPTRDALGAAIAALEGGAGAVVTSSGMAAVSLVAHLLKADDLLLAPHDCYGGTYRLFSALAKRGALKVEFVDQTDDEALEKAFRLKPKLVWIETPSNPLLRIVDIAGMAERSRTAGALLLVDNTFLSPGWQRPPPGRLRPPSPAEGARHSPARPGASYDFSSTPNHSGGTATIAGCGPVRSSTASATRSPASRCRTRSMS